jgi:hypothetical protein
MTARATLSTARRVLRQLRRDPRSIAMLLLVPVLLLSLLRGVFDGRPQAFDAAGGPVLALFPFTMMFLLTSVAMLRERTTGTLERLLATPLGRGDLLAGYALAFGGVAVVQSLFASAFALGLLGPGRRRLRGAGRRARRRQRAARHGHRPAAQRLRRTEFQACSSCRRSSCPRCCCAGCSRPATPWSRRSGGCPTPSRSPTPWRGCSRSRGPPT